MRRCATVAYTAETEQLILGRRRLRDPLHQRVKGFLAVLHLYLAGSLFKLVALPFGGLFRQISTPSSASSFQADRS